MSQINNRANDKTTRPELIMVKPTTKIDAVAKLFDEHGVNAAPVVDGVEKCVGVITSHDLVQYEANRIEFENQNPTGIAFKLSPRETNQPSCLVGQPFNEVAYHMSTDFGTIKEDSLPAEAGRLMCQKHLHHLITLDASGRPISIISSLDVIGELLGEQVQRLDRVKLLQQRKQG